MDRIPVSLVNPTGATPDDRRALSGVTAGNNPPSGQTAGFRMEGGRFLHVVVKIKDAGESIQWKLWVWSSFSGEWCLDTRPGAVGVVHLAEDDVDHPQHNIIDVAGVDRVYIELANPSGGISNGVDVWLARSERIGN